MEPPITAFQLLALSALLAPDEQRGGYNLGYGRRENIQCSPSRSGWRHISRRSDDAEDGRRERPRRIERISAPSLERRANETMTWSIPEVGTVGKGKV